MKKFISLMVLFAMSSFALAQDVEEEEEEEEEEVVEVVKAKPAPKKAQSNSDSKLGLQVSLSGDSRMVNVVYDMGTGLAVLVGVDAMQYKDQAAKTVNAVGLGLGAEYELGKELLPYGVGGRLEFYNAAMGLNDWQDENMFKGMTLTPYFFTKAELVKNVYLGVQAGVYYRKPSEGDASIGLHTSGNLSFFFK